MKTYARIQDGQVAELFATDADIRQLFHAGLMWVDVTAQGAVDIGWTFDGVTFTAPAEIVRPTAAMGSISDLQRQVALLSAQLAALARG